MQVERVTEAASCVVNSSMDKITKEEVYWFTERQYYSTNLQLSSTTVNFCFKLIVR